MEEIQTELVRKAGAIVLRNNRSAQIALIFRGKEKDWSFPKGHIELGEESLVACIREVKEETGLDVEVVLQLPNNEYLHESGKKIITYMYLVISKEVEFLTEKQGDKIEWVDIEKVGNKLGYDNLKEYYVSILPIIKNEIKKKFGI